MQLERGNAKLGTLDLDRAERLGRAGTWHEIFHGRGAIISSLSATPLCVWPQGKGGRMLSVVTAITCESASELPPYTLHKVRTRWRRPPESLCVYVEVLNLTGEPYDISAEVWRRSSRIASFERELILMSRRDRDEVILALNLENRIKPKTHSLRILLNGDPA